MFDIFHNIKKIFCRDNGRSNQRTTKSKPIQIHTGSNLITSPFFVPHTGQKLTYTRTYSNDNSLPNVNILDTVTLNRSLIGPSLRDLYSGLKDRDHGFVIDKWCFLSAKEIDEHKKAYDQRSFTDSSESKRLKMLDIALSYRGMGHIVVIAYIPDTDKFFFRHDGGSNGYERVDYYDQYSDDKFKPSELPIYVREVFTNINQTLGFYAQQDNRIQMLTQYSYHNMMQIIDPKWVFLY